MFKVKRDFSDFCSDISVFLSFNMKTIMIKFKLGYIWFCRSDLVIRLCLINGCSSMFRPEKKTQQCLLPSLYLLSLHLVQLVSPVKPTVCAGHRQSHQEIDALPNSFGASQFAFQSKTVTYIVFISSIKGPNANAFRHAFYDLTDFLQNVSFESYLSVPQSFKKHKMCILIGNRSDMFQSV
ncbi:hypothetical protein AMECASPLE_022981 [Ameca splendens]|uniref:Uncharacterized protein n=1 Tax=Ameca splendens TaxID=208324 RepID=A0ABV0XGY9_9TELE